MPARVLVQAGHHPAAGGAPGEAGWAFALAERVGDRLRAAGVDAVLVGDWYGRAPPAAVAADASLFVSLHYDAAVYGARPGGNSGAFGDRAARDPAGAESDRALLLWERRYFPGAAAAGHPLRNAAERRNPNTQFYYGFAATTARTPGILLEHGVGALVGTGGFPPGDDGAFLHGRLDLVADLDAGAVLAFLGLPPPAARGQAWCPLAGVDDADPTQGGYRYLERTAEGVYHPGVDWNTPGGAQTDCGALVRARCAGVVRYVGYHATASGRGFGWHVWLEADGGAGWPHLCHLQATPRVGPGDRVAPDTVLGACGRTAGWPHCHVHGEVYRAAPPGGDWGYWPVDRARAAVADLTYDPTAWFARWLGAPPAAGGEEPEDVGIIEEQGRQIAALEEEVRVRTAERDTARATVDELVSTVGSLREDVEKPLRAEVAALKAGATAAETRLAVMGAKIDTLMAQAQEVSRVLVTIGNRSWALPPD